MPKKINPIFLSQKVKTIKEIKEDKISLYQDPWLIDQAERYTIWIVDLSDGSTVYQDDNRPGLSIPSAWIRLKNYCENNHLFIKKMWIRFRSHIEFIGENKEGFYFCKSISGGLGGGIVNSYLTGTVFNGILTVEKWRVPELIRIPFLDDSMIQTRDLNKNKDCLIMKNG